MSTDNVEHNSETLQESDAGSCAPESEEAAGEGLVRAIIEGLSRENEALSRECERLRTENERITEAEKRLQADFDNHRRRTERERDGVAIFANEALIRSLIPALDNMERALAAAPSDDPLAVGVRLVHKQLSEALGKAGLVGVDSVGRPFDPNLHEAVGQVEAEGMDDDTVVDELQRGYTLGGRLLRAAVVRVSKS